MPAGHNGPHGDPETPVRNTSHWLITFVKAFEVSGEGRFLEAARRCVGYLSSDAARPMKAAFWHRTNPEKDFGNGLIGQAWTIQALARAAPGLGADPALSLAADVFLRHAFEDDRGLFRRLHVDGSLGPVQNALNQQVWLALAGAEVARALPAADRRRGEIERRVDAFVARLPRHLAWRASGLLVHDARRIGKEGWKRRIRNSLWRPAHPQEVGYHAFNLLGLALLDRARPLGADLVRGVLARPVALLFKSWFFRALEDDRFAFRYNPAGFEAAVAVTHFRDALGLDPAASRELVARLVARQVERHFCHETALMNRSTDDPATLAARFCEATWL